MIALPPKTLLLAGEASSVDSSAGDPDQPVRVSGGHRPGGLFVALVREPSMVPTLRDGDAILVRRTGRARPGDVVVAQFAGHPDLYVKRAVRPVPGGWWVIGDNEYASTDSRQLGPATIVGRVLLRWWPRPGRLRRTR
jgi:phage repressor protein C with HTH and peptisase S24 domain